MIDRETLIEVLELGEQRRAARRKFLKAAGAATVAIGGSSLLAACGDDDNDNGVSTPLPTPTPTPAVADADVLNFALNLEYLEANYYIAAATGSPLNSALRTGTGSQGDVVGGKLVQFGDATVASYAREIAADEVAHVTFLRTQLGSSAVAMPQINIDGGASGAFTAAARAAGVVPQTGTFDPYASDDNWLLGGMLLSDVGVTAYKGAAQLLTSATVLEAAAGILATEAYHSGLIRTLLYRRGLQTPSLRTNAGLISDARDSLDGPSNLDEGVVGQDTSMSNIVPADPNGIVFGRTAAQVLNIAYLNKAAVTSGGFFPAGTNGNIKTSGANG